MSASQQERTRFTDRLLESGLPPDIVGRALMNMVEFQHPNPTPFQVDDMTGEELLYRSFSWAGAPEGSRFWQEVTELCGQIEREVI